MSLLNEVEEFLKSKINIKSLEAFCDEGELTINYIACENEDPDSIIPDSLDELVSIVKKRRKFNQIAWSENLIFIS